MLPVAAACRGTDCKISASVVQNSLSVNLLSPSHRAGALASCPGTPPPGPAKRCVTAFCSQLGSGQGICNPSKTHLPKNILWQLPKEYVFLPSFRLKLCPEQPEDWATGSTMPKSALGVPIDLMKQCLFDKCF